MSQQNPSPSVAKPLEVTFELDGDVAFVKIRGDVDASTTDDLRRIIGGVVSLGARSFMLDCSAMSYLDSSGIRFIVDLHRNLQGQGGTITILDAPAPIRRVIHITGLDTLVHLA